MILVIEGRGTKVNQSDFAVEKNAPLTSVSWVRVGGGRDGTVVCEGLVSIADEENIFGFKVGMDEVEVVED